MLESVEEYARRYNELYKETMCTLKDGRNILEAAEDSIVQLFGGAQPDVCTNSHIDEGNAGLSPQMINGMGNKLGYQIQLLAYYHIAIKHRQDLDTMEELVLLREIWQLETTMAMVKQALDEINRRRGNNVDTVAEDLTKDILSKLFGNNKRKGDDQ